MLTFTPERYTKCSRVSIKGVTSGFSKRLALKDAFSFDVPLEGGVTITLTSEEAEAYDKKPEYKDVILLNL